jgi:hypothetical protein
MSRSPEPPSRWPKPPRSRPLALRPEDFASLSGQGASDLQRRMDAWAAGVVERLEDLGVVATTDGTERDKGAISPHVRFVLRGAPADATRLVLGMDAVRVRAGLELPPSQARAVRAWLSDPAHALELATALEALPEQFTMGASGDLASAEAPRATADDMRALLDRIEREGSTAWIGWSVPRELAVEHAALLAEQLADAVVALAQLFALLGADAVDRPGTRGDHGAAGGAKGRRFSGRRAAADRPRGEDDERDRGRTARTRPRGREREHEPEREAEAEPEPVREAPQARGRGLDAKPPPRPGSRRRPSKASPVVIERGARVHVLKGPFSGKVGVVHELDGKGGARVMLGLLAVRLEVGNLVPVTEGGGRPRLSSSHRKPIPARS